MYYIVGLHFKHIVLATLMEAKEASIHWDDHMESLGYEGFDIYDTEKGTIQYISLIDFYTMISSEKFEHAFANVELEPMHSSSWLRHELQKYHGKVGKNDRDKANERNLASSRLGVTPLIQPTVDVASAVDISINKNSNAAFEMTNYMLIHKPSCMSLNHYSRFWGKGTNAPLHSGFVLFGYDEFNDECDYIYYSKQEGKYITKTAESLMTLVADMQAEKGTLANAELVEQNGSYILKTAEMLDSALEPFLDGGAAWQAGKELLTSNEDDYPFMLKPNAEAKTFHILGLKDNAGVSTKYGKTLVIPEGVTHIDNSAFAFLEDPELTLIFPKTLRKIGKHAFKNAHVKALVFQSCTNIQYEAFVHLHAERVAFGFGLQRLGNGCFRYAYIQEPVRFPRTLEQVGIAAFLRSSTKYIFDDNSVLYVGSQAFSKACIDNMPSSTLYIGSHAMAGATVDAGTQCNITAYSILMPDAFVYSPEGWLDDNTEKRYTERQQNYIKERRAAKKAGC